MDQSADSIGSCSLDIDADTSDISDTSGSLNFPTPISITDITREFTGNIRERCIDHNTTNFINSVNGQMCMVLTQPRSTGTDSTISITTTTPTVIENIDKKPSYLNLACCVNGYSNLTTYDSKIRQHINKSREVSPIRPSSSNIQYCKKNNSLAPPVLLVMPTIDKNTVNSTTEMTCDGLAITNNQENGNGDLNESLDASSTECRGTSFIQQRVERLYGPGALAQGFYSPRRMRVKMPHDSSNLETTELAKKFEQLSPSKHIKDFEKKINNTLPITNTTPEKNNVDLPVFRHLSEEFRAQLPSISPKKNLLRNSGRNNSDEMCGEYLSKSSSVDEIDHEIISKALEIGEQDIKTGDSKNKQSPIEALEKKSEEDVNVFNENTGLVKRDGNYFLNVLKSEQIRLLSLASEAEKYIDALTDKSEISEDTLGFLRSASGKARLLASQKMKQFEGLCHNNLNQTTNEKFPTTTDDLQGFWDMVNLQIDHINLLFDEINKMKNNNWKRTEDLLEKNISTNKSQKLIKTGSSKTKTINCNNGNNAKGNTPMSAAALKRESQRKQLMEMKRKNRIAMASNTAVASDDVESC